MKVKIITLLALTLYSHLPADAYLTSAAPPLKAQTEFEQLAVIMAKYGNNLDGLRAIDYAILMQDEAAIDLLLKYGATLGRGSLGYAIKSGNFDLFKKLAELGLDLNGRLNDSSFLYIAIVEHQNDIARYLIDHGVKLEFEYKHSGSENLLNDCAEAGNFEIYSLLVSKHVQPFDEDYFYSRLVSSTSYISTLGINKTNDKKMEMLSTLLDQYILDPNKLIFNSTTPLLFLATNGVYRAQYTQWNLEVLKLLLKSGADAAAINSLGTSIFTYGPLLVECTESFEIQTEIIQLLVAHGADINHKDSEAKTPLQYAKGARMINFLKRLGAK